MLMLFEDTNSERESQMSTHVLVIECLLKTRGPGQLGDPATQSLFHFALGKKGQSCGGLIDVLEQTDSAHSIGGPERPDADQFGLADGGPHDTTADL